MSEELNKLLLEKNTQIVKLMARMKELEDRVHWSECLEAAGVDGWDGFDTAIDIFESI